MQKKTVIPVGVDLARSNSLMSPVVGWFSTIGVLLMKIKRLLEYKGEFFSIFCKIFVPRSEGPPLRSNFCLDHNSYNLARTSI